MSDHVKFIQGNAIQIPLADDSVDLVFGSPPYAGKASRYNGGLSVRWSPEAWVEFMLRVTQEACRVSKGFVIWVVNDPVSGGRHHPACAGLQWEWYRRGLGWNERPDIWHKNAPPNRCRKDRQDWFSNDYEPVLVFMREGVRPQINWQEVADPPRYDNGGHFRQRDAKGSRKRGSDYPKTKLARPRDVFRALVGGGHMGHKLACQNEAPFPLALAERYVKACCPPGGTVLDPFCGSGTTGHAAILHGRRAVLMDVRDSQIELSRRRLDDVAGQMQNESEDK